MINIPIEVQELFKTNSVRKCFHVHFPNGEFRDLWNSDIVTESVTFKESLCSQQYLKFGLTEASSIEFECVGIPNIRGALIQCAIEIDITSLGESWISAHSESKDIVVAVESGDAMGAENGNAIGGTIYGSEYFLDPQVVTSEGFIAYRIPYGEFVVDSCPRNHGAMAHRKVTAYSKQVTEDAIQIDGVQKAASMIVNPITYKTVSDLDIDSMTNMSYYTVGSDGLPNYPALLNSSSAFIDTNAVRPMIYQLTVSGDDINKPLCIYVDYPESELDEIANDLIKLACKVAPSGYIYSSSLHSKIFNTTAQGFAVVSGDFSPCIYIEKGGGYTYPIYINKGQKYIIDLRNCKWRGGKEYIQNSYTLSVVIPVYWTNAANATWSRYNSSGTLQETIAINGWTLTTETLRCGNRYRVEFASNYAPYLTVKYKLLDAPDSNLDMNIEQTLEVSKPYLGNYYTYANAFSFREMMSGYYEMCGTFEKQERDGSYTEYLLSNNNPYSMTPEDYSDLWWEEYSVQPIGRLEYEWNDGNDTKSGSLTLSSGKSVYSFADNYVLKHLYKPTESKIRSLLRTHFVPKIRNVAFTPIDLNARGLPFLEAGDYLNLTAYDGTAVNSYILERTIKGIQSLQDTIASEGGEVIE